MLQNGRFWGWGGGGGGQTQRITTPLLLFVLFVYWVSNIQTHFRDCGVLGDVCKVARASVCLDSKMVAKQLNSHLARA